MGSCGGTPRLLASTRGVRPRLMKHTAWRHTTPLGRKDLGPLQPMPDCVWNTDETGVTWCHPARYGTKAGMVVAAEKGRRRWLATSLPTLMQDVALVAGRRLRDGDDKSTCQCLKGSRYACERPE